MKAYKKKIDNSINFLTDGDEKKVSIFGLRCCKEVQGPQGKGRLGRLVDAPDVGL